ncbi:MAG: response regulator [Steroidobacteraceae bacterium]
MHTLAEQEKVNILLVDDQPARLLSYESILGGLGQNLVSANSGTEALQQVLRMDFAVILLDVSMPEMDGFETAAMIHEHPRYEHTPIIFVTGIHVTELDRLKGYKLGAVDYVSIPIVPEILRSKVSVLVELHCQRKKLQELNASLAAANARLELDNSTLQAEKNHQLEILNRHLREANEQLERSNAALSAENQERIRAESALKEMDRHKDEFLAILAHELRNPLAPIRHAVDLMTGMQLQDPALNWSREVIGRQVTHLTRLVDDLLDISRITHGTIKLNKEEIPVKAIVDRAVESLQPVMLSYQHRLEVQCDNPAAVVYGDLIRLVQVLGNLLSNAAKYTPSNGLIRLVVSVDAAQVEFRVIDSGIGIEPESVPKLFNLFSQIPGSGNQQESGLGIGLALVKHLVGLHDGEVSVNSGGLNAGSEFTFRLPLHAASSVVVIESTQPRPIAARQVLVVDDNLDALEGLALLLELAGHTVFKASDGAEALALVAKHHPEMAILDIGMPVMDGYELAGHLRSEPLSRGMFLIALSGWGQSEDIHRAHEAGFDFHLVKPATFDAISDLMTKLGERTAA